MADLRYMEAWAGGGRGRYADLKTTPYQVRLDTPGGITYAPPQLASSNSTKRTFVPHSRVPDYDYDREIETKRNDGAGSASASASVAGKGTEEAAAHKAEVETLAEGVSAFVVGDEADEEGDQVSALSEQAQAQGPKLSSDDTPAARYAASISMQPDTSRTASDQSSKSVPDAAHQHAGRAETVRGQGAPSISNMSMASNFSRMTSMTKASELTAAASANGMLPRVRSSGASVWNAPPSIAGGNDGGITPWNASAWNSHPAFERPRDSDTETLSSFVNVNGLGSPPTSPDPDSATLDGKRRLRPSDVFIPDPRPWHPLRYVRRTDPRQVLLLCAGAVVPANAVASNASASDKGKSKAGSMLSNATSGLASAFSSTENASFRGGLGFVYCPPVSAANSAPTDSSTSTLSDYSNPALAARAEPNFSRRLEAPGHQHKTTGARAALRSVLAALEYVRWEEEGFDKIVLATHHEWIVRGITKDIWEWRWNSWRLTRATPQGGPGETVPDRDLWELLDAAVKGYEKADMNVRFWIVNKEDNKEARRLAVEGAYKENQQPATVRWTRKLQPKVETSTSESET